MPTKQGADPGGWVDWVASHPPLWGRLSLKLEKGTKLSLRRFCLGLFRYRYTWSTPLLQKSWIRHCKLAYQNLNPDSIRSLFTEHITSQNLKKQFEISAKHFS